MRPVCLWAVVIAAGCQGGLGPPPIGREGSPPGDGGGGVRLMDAAAAPPPAGEDAGRSIEPPPAPPPPPSGTDAGPPPPPPPDDSVTLTAEEQGLVDAINAERATRGLMPVEVEERLLCAARRHALDVGGSGECGHVGSDGSWPWDRAMACGFPQERWTVNEIAAGPGFTDGADAVWGWRHSDGHYAALMHESARYIGVGVERSCFIALFDCCVAGSE